MNDNVVNAQEEIKTFPFGVNKTYSLGYWLKDYGYYPQSWPLFTYMDHGMTLFDKIPHHEIYNDAPLIFKFSPRLVKIYREQHEKPVYNLLNPAIHYRWTHRVKKSDEATGTIFYVAHSTPLIDDLTDWQSFIDEINQVPIMFHPIDICLHPVDIKKGLDKIFTDNGFRVVCSDQKNRLTFIENFYNILRNYKYSMSNLIGSYTFYSVELGIPFSLYGSEPQYFNRGDRNVEMGDYTSFKGNETYKKAVSLFEGLHTTIGDDQKHFVEFELGKFTTISRLKAATLLYKALLTYILRKPSHLKFVLGPWIKSVRLLITS